MEEPTIQEKVDFLNYILYQIYDWDIKRNKSAYIENIRGIYDRLCSLPEEDTAFYVDEIRKDIRALHKEMETKVDEAETSGISELNTLLQGLKW
jgi:hypothetical protein